MNEFLILSLGRKENLKFQRKYDKYINILTIDFILPLKQALMMKFKLTWKLQILLPQPLNSGYKHESVWLNA